MNRELASNSLAVLPALAVALHRESRTIMYTLVLASQKGGSGKTTLSGHLAVQAEISGAGPVALIDTDPQGSLAQWWNGRESDAPHFAKVGLLDLADVLAELEMSGFKLVVIDTPPAITASISQVVSHADLVVIPARPSPHDLRAVGATADIAARNEKPVVFVINGATKRARITGEAAVALSQHGMVAPVMVHNRVDFAASMVDGRTVGEVVPGSASANEVRDLWAYVQDRLFRLKRDPSIMPKFRADHLSVSALTALDTSEPAEADDAIEPEAVVAEPAASVAAFERRPAHTMLFGGGGERRNNAFGRRTGDQQANGRGP
jgi:chromosome partitioning protein